MRLLFLISTIIFLSCSGGNKEKKPIELPAPPPVVDTPVKGGFLPVTEMLKGQLYEMKQTGKTALKYTVRNGVTDSAWLKTGQEEKELQEFFSPVIDSASLSDYFTETKFLDQTLEAFTFTYEPVKSLPDSIPYSSWSVYLDQETQKLKRIYLIKKEKPNITLQLTWQAGKWAKIVTIAENPGGTAVIEKEVKISWDY